MSVPSWVWGSGGALVVSAAARALPQPLSTDSRLYLWFYNFAGVLLANWDKIGAAPADWPSSRANEPMTPIGSTLPPFAPGTEEKKNS